MKFRVPQTFLKRFCKFLSPLTRLSTLLVSLLKHFKKAVLKEKRTCILFYLPTTGSLIL